MFHLFIQNLWIIASAMIFSCGLYYSFRLHFVHLKWKSMLKAVMQKPNQKNSISSFQSFSMSLAGRIGVGSLSGIALAVYLGGPGVLFWIWITSFFCASTTFAESVLAVIFRKRESGNIYRGGPFYYIQEGLKNKKLALFYAVVILITFIAGFSTMQVNTMVKCLTSVTSANPMILTLFIVGITGASILGGVRSISHITSIFIPIVTISYCFICIYIILMNINMLPKILIDIFHSALSFKTFGLGIVSTLLIGMQKGIFSSEAGLGTGSIAAATSALSFPSQNGLAQTFGIHIENLLIATITVFVICMSHYNNLVIPDPNGIELTLYAFAFHLNSFGITFITIAISIFAISSVLAGYYYSESSLKFIKNVDRKDILFLQIVFLLFLFIGCIISSQLLWDIVDVFIGMIAIVNIYALFRLRKMVIKEYLLFKKQSPF